MNQEQSDGTGYFDGDTYVFRKRNEDEEPDAWLESLQEQGDAALYTGKDDSESETDESASVKMDNWSKNDLYACIIPLVSDTETVMQAIARYGNLVKRKPGRSVAADASQAIKAAQESILRLTEAASALLLQGQVDIYQMTRNQLLAATKDLIGNGAEQPRDNAGNSTNGPPSTPKEVVQWEYQGSQDGQIHGPYSTQNMRDWIAAGYFVGPSAVKVRSIAQRERTKTAQEDLLDDLESDDDANDAKPQSTETVRGEWLQSDQVDFSQFG
jgi:CD2 antigen cytoplasmic tail-binding protein 2